MTTNLLWTEITTNAFWGKINSQQETKSTLRDPKITINMTKSNVLLQFTVGLFLIVNSQWKNKVQLLSRARTSSFNSVYLFNKNSQQKSLWGKNKSKQESKFSELLPILIKIHSHTVLYETVAHPEQHRGDSRKKQLHYNSKTPPAEPDSGLSAICVECLGFERTGSLYGPDVLSLVQVCFVLYKKKGK